MSNINMEQEGQRQDEVRAQKWDLKNIKGENLETDQRNSSIVLLMKVSGQICLLQQFLELYSKFNVHLGSIASGPRHKGFLDDIFSTVKRLEDYCQRLSELREEKQRGTEMPGEMEMTAEEICEKFKAHKDKVWDIMEERVAMTNVSQRDAWVTKKDQVLKDVMGWTLTKLNNMDAKYPGWKELEVRTLEQRWEMRWRGYAAMNPEDQKVAGWILDV